MFLQRISLARFDNALADTPYKDMKKNNIVKKPGRNNHGCSIGFDSGFS
jgi:hypothetical protein